MRRGGAGAASALSLLIIIIVCIPAAWTAVVPSIAFMARLRAQPSARRLLLAGLLLAAVVLVVCAPVFMLAMAPAIGLFAMVAHRIMPGERLIVRLRERTAPRRRRAVAVQRPYEVILVRRTGRLLASALAMRPPPAPLHVSS